MLALNTFKFFVLNAAVAVNAAVLLTHDAIRGVQLVRDLVVAPLHHPGSISDSRSTAPTTCSASTAGPVRRVTACPFFNF